MWTNSVEVANHVRDEARRETWRRQRGIQGKDQREWREVMQDGIKRETDRREEIGEVNEIIEENTAGILIVGEADNMQACSNEEYWDEITQKRLDQTGVRNV